MLNIIYENAGPAFPDASLDGMATVLVNGLLQPARAARAARAATRTSTGALIDAIVNQVIAQGDDHSLVTLRIGDQVYELNQHYVWTKAGQAHIFENLLHLEWPTTVEYGERRLVYAINTNRRKAKENLMKPIFVIDAQILFGMASAPPDKLLQVWGGPTSSEYNDLSVYVHGALESACGYDLVTLAKGHIQRSERQDVQVVDVTGNIHDAVMVIIPHGYYAGRHCAYIVTPDEVEMAENDLHFDYGRKPQ